MTTADITLGFADFGWWLFGLEEKGRAALMRALGWFSDGLRWLRREMSRRKGYPTGAHRRGPSVWDYLHALPIEELKYEWRPPGQHRDRRGWRYVSGVWYTIERSVREREWIAYWHAQVNWLMDEIQYMLDHPPAAATVTVHGCQDCICGQIAEIRAEALA